MIWVLRCPSRRLGGLSGARNPQRHRGVWSGNRSGHYVPRPANDFRPTSVITVPVVDDDNATYSTRKRPHTDVFALIGCTGGWDGRDDGIAVSYGWVCGVRARLRERPADVCSAQSSSLKIEISFSPPRAAPGHGR